MAARPSPSATTGGAGATCSSAGCTWSRRSRGSARRSTSSRSTTTSSRRPTSATRDAASAARRGRSTAAASTASRSSGSRRTTLPEPLTGSSGRRTRRGSRASRCSSSSTSSTRSTFLVDPSVADLSSVGGDRDRRRRARCSPGSSTTGSAGVLGDDEWRSRSSCSRSSCCPRGAPAQLFAARAAYLEVGAMLGTIMVGERLLRDHPGALGARAREAGGPRARPALERPRQAALGAQQLPHAAGRLRDALEPLPVHVRARARLADPRRADGARRAGSATTSTCATRAERLVDPRRARQRDRRRSRSGSGRSAHAAPPGPPPCRSRGCRRSSSSAACRATRAPDAARLQLGADGDRLDTRAEIESQARADRAVGGRQRGDAARQRDRA